MALECGSFEQFPVHGLLPKREIGAERFLTKFPQFNGKDVLIAIFDSGVDPGAPGLQKLPDGRRKIVDLLDCSGSGDVDMTTKRTVMNGLIEGLSGRILKIPDEWHNPSGIYRVGLKSAYALFPSKLKDRLQKERKERVWNVSHSKTHAEATQNLHEFEKANPDLNKLEVKLEYENLKALPEVLQTVNKKWKDHGPIYDCVSFYDGTTWRACVDTSEKGNLGKCKLLSSFRESGEYATFGQSDMLNFSINVYNDGDILSIVTNCSSHGTHVASIASAYFEDEPEQNGVAPGAQIISMKIGDTKLQSMETGVAMMRAQVYAVWQTLNHDVRDACLPKRISVGSHGEMFAAIRNKVDVINMSYGEGSKWPNSGQVIRLMNKLSKEHHIVFISSAGNNGPALSTVGSPGGTCDGVIGVGAYVSPDMMAAEYSLLEKMPGRQYTWSSRGPCVDGALGVCITAPGGAFTSVPNWTLRSFQLMNGTSMSSPNACGGIALLLSALKQERIQCSPASIRNYIEYSAARTEGVCPFTFGHGMLQVDKAYELIKNEVRSWISTATFQVECGVSKARGIYLRETRELAREMSTNVTITPSFRDSLDNKKKIDFSVKVCLQVTVPWITSPSHFAMANMGRSFVVKVDPRGLSPGAHFGEVIAYDTQNPTLSPVFRIPVSVIIPTRLKPDYKHGEPSLTMKAGAISRYFYSVPDGATWAQVTLKSLDEDKDARYLIHALQVKKDLAFRETEFHRLITLKSQAESVLDFAVLGGYTMELCLARWWANIGESNLSWEISFHGLNPNCSSVSLNGCEGYTRVDVKCPFGQEELSPTASLTHYVLPIRPREHVIRPLGERDILPSGQPMHQMVLVYHFSLLKSAEVTPIAPLLHDLLYESKFSSQYWMIFDNNKRLYGAGDAFPYKNNYSLKLEKGEYILKFEIRHINDETLERLKDMVLNFKIKLNTAITLDCFSSRKKIFSQDAKHKFSAVTLHQGEEVPVYITALSEDKFPKGIKQGQFLTGTLAFSKKESLKKVAAVPLECSVAPPRNASDKTAKTKEQKDLSQEYSDAYDEFLALWVGKLHGSTAQSEVIDKSKKDATIRNAILNAMDGSKERNSILHEIIEEADRIIAMIDTEELLKYCGMKSDLSPNAAKTKSKMESQKSILINALCKKGIAAADIMLKNSPLIQIGRKKVEASSTADKAESGTSTHREVTLKDLDQIYEEFAKWVDPNDTKMRMFLARHGMAYNHHGRALRSLLKFTEENSMNKVYDELMIQMCIDLGWTHMAQYLQHWMLLRYPPVGEPLE